MSTFLTTGRGTLDWVDNGLAVGRLAEATDEDTLRSNDIDAIVCLETEFPDYPALPGLAVAHFGFPNGGQLSEKTLMGCLTTIHKWLEMGHSVLLHCGSGISRAPTIAMAYLAWRYRIPWSIAENIVRERHLSASPHPELVRQAKEHLNRWEISAT